MRTSLNVIGCILLLFGQAAAREPEQYMDLAPQLHAIANMSQESPVIPIPAGDFLMGTTRRSTLALTLEDPYDDTEQPQRRIWLDAYQIDCDKVSLGEYVRWLSLQKQALPAPLHKLIHSLQGWKTYSNARFGFSVRYPADWRLGDPLPGGVGITLYPPTDYSQVVVLGFMNVIEGESQDGRQTLEEFSSAHRRIIIELYAKKHISIQWRADKDASLANFPAKRLSFTYRDGQGNEMLEIHIFSVGRNDGRGVRIKLPSVSEKDLLPLIKEVVETFELGRDQNAVSPLVPKTEQR